MTALYNAAAAEVAAHGNEPFLDRCPQCVGKTGLRPRHVTITSDSRAHCDYRCPRCSHSWAADWETLGEDPKYLWTGPR